MTASLFQALEIPVAAQIAELERELSLRARVYPRWVEQGRLAQDAADEQIAAMRAAVRSLQILAEVQRMAREGARGVHYETTARSAVREAEGIVAARLEAADRGRDFDRGTGLAP